MKSNIFLGSTLAAVLLTAMSFPSAAASACTALEGACEKLPEGEEKELACALLAEADDVADTACQTIQDVGAIIDEYNPNDGKLETGAGAGTCAAVFAVLTVAVNSYYSEAAGEGLTVCTAKATGGAVQTMVNCGGVSVNLVTDAVGAARRPGLGSATGTVIDVQGNTCSRTVHATQAAAKL